MFLACPAPPNETWGVAGPLPVVMGPKWGPVVVFLAYPASQDAHGGGRPLAGVYGGPNETSSWWFAEAPKRPPVGVSWPVPPLSGRGGAGQLVVVCGGPEEAPSCCSRRPLRGLQWVFRDLFPHWAGGAEQANWWWWWWLFFLGGRNPPGLVFRDLFPHWAGGAEQANWWLDAEAPKRPPGGFRPVFPLGMGKTGLIFDLRPSEVKAYFMLFDPSGLSKRVWEWWFINNVFFKSFWPIRPPKTRLREW